MNPDDWTKLSLESQKLFILAIIDSIKNLENKVEVPEMRKKMLDLSVVLFAELQNAGYLRW